MRLIAAALVALTLGACVDTDDAPGDQREAAPAGESAEADTGTDPVVEWVDRYGNRLVAVNDTFDVIAEASARFDTDALAAACADLSDAAVAVRQLPPSSDPAFDTPLMAAMDLYETAGEECIIATLSLDADLLLRSMELRDQGLLEAQRALDLYASRAGD